MKRRRRANCVSIPTVCRRKLLEKRVNTLTKYIVEGGKPLYGEVEISGAKNAAVAIIPAALLVDGVCGSRIFPRSPT